MKRYASIRLFAAAALLIASGSCKNDDKEPGLNGPAILAIENAPALPVEVSLIAPKTKSFDIRVAAQQISGEFVTVTFKVDRTLVDAYNKANGTNYKLMPSEAYEFTNNEVMLPRYNTVSSTAQVTLISEKMPDEEKYLLPITIDQIKGDAQATVAETNNVYYILFNKVVLPPPMLLDRTDWKLLYVPGTKTGYGTERILDGNPGTFAFCNSTEDGFSQPFYIVIDLGREFTISGLKLTSRAETGEYSTTPRYPLYRIAIETAQTITGNGMTNESDWTYSENYNLPAEMIVNPSLSELQRARYIRFKMIDCYKRWNTSTGFLGWCLAEFDVWGYLEDMTNY